MPEPVTLPPTQNFGRLLREWRGARQVSQLELALRAGASVRHTSFVETGRAAPSRDFVLRLAEALDLPLRARNDLLKAAGYAPIFRESAPAEPVAALRAAFDALLPLAGPTHQAAVLRAALKTLIEGETSPRSGPSRPRGSPLAHGEALLPWPELPGRLRAQKDHEKIATAEIAAALGITRPHLTRILCPSGGRQVFAALQAWLEARSKGQSGPLNLEIGSSRPSKLVSCSKNPPLAPQRLTTTQREELAGEIALDPKSLRAAGLSREVAEMAVGGQNLEPANIERLTAFLGGGISTAAG